MKPLSIPLRFLFFLGCVGCCITATSQTSLTLNQLLDSALQNNLATRDARLAIQAANEQRREAFTNFFPNISGTALWFNANKSMARMDIDPSEFITPELGAALAQSLPAEALMALSSPMTMTMMKNGTIAGIEAMLPIFTGGQIINGNKLARLGEQVSQLQLQLSEKEVEAQTEQYYWQLVAMEEKERTLDAVDALLADVAKDAQAAVDAGVALRNDLLQVQLRQNEMASQRLKLNNGQALLHLILTQYCGLKGTWTLAPADLSTMNALPLRDQAAISLLPEYQLLQKNVEAARLQYKMEVGKHMPSVAIGAGYNYHNLLDNNRSFGMVFATASVPISDWWGGSHAIRRKRIERQRAIEKLNDNAELLRIRAQKAFNDVMEAESQLTLAERSIEQADENLRIHQDTYHAGTSTMSDLLEAQLLLQQAKDKRTDAFIALQNAILAYRQATEGE
ncbi:MAG: TolC family protein [Bacteroidaceae bacterium]|nr:TolC family protein [Bacteroidaceae bacterium]